MSLVNTQLMRWVSAVLFVTLLALSPMGALADGGRAAPDCVTVAVGDVQSTVGVDSGACVIVWLGTLQPGDVYDLSVIVVNDAIDLLFFDENGIQPYELGQSYRSSMAQPASTESALGAYEFHWKVPPSIAAKNWYMVLDNQAHDGDAGEGDQGGQRSTVSASVSPLTQAYWTPYHDLVAVESGAYSVLLSGDDLRLDAGTTVVVSAWDMEFIGDVYLQTRAMHDRYTTGAVGVQFIDGGALQTIDTPKSLTWQVPASLEGQELLLVVDNTDAPLGGGNGTQPLRMTVRLELAPPLTPVITDDQGGVVSLGESMMLDASSTPNRLGQQGVFSWDIDADVDSNQDGNDTNDADANGVAVSAMWTTPGSKTLTVRMTAPSGEVAFATHVITVEDTVVPVARIQATNAVPVSGGWRVNVGQSVTLDCSSSSDDDAVAACAWTVDGELAGNNATLVLNWPDLGLHDVMLTVTDMSGNTASSNITLRTVDATVPQIAPASGSTFPEIANQGETISLAVDVSDGYDAATALRVHWDLQPSKDTDGNGDPRDDADLMGLNPKITFDQAGEQAVVVTVFDASNNSAAYAFSVAVKAAPEASVSMGPALVLLGMLAVVGLFGAVGYRTWQRKLALDLLLDRGLSEEEARAHMAAIAQQSTLSIRSKAVHYAGLDRGEVRPQAEQEAQAKQAEFDAIYGASGEVDQTVAFAPPAYASTPMSQASSQAAAEAAALLSDEGGISVSPSSTPGMDALSALMDDDVDEDVESQHQPTTVAVPHQGQEGAQPGIALPSMPDEPTVNVPVTLPESTGGVALPTSQPATASAGGVVLPQQPMASGQTPAPTPTQGQPVREPSPAIVPPPPPAPALVRHTCTACSAVFEVDVPAGLTQALVGCPGCDVDQTIVVHA